MNTRKAIRQKADECEAREALQIEIYDCAQLYLHSPTRWSGVPRVTPILIINTANDTTMVMLELQRRVGSCNGLFLPVPPSAQNK
jgi:hypothetical protein